METFTPFTVLAFTNLILSSAIVLTAFSLLAYLLTHNFRSPVARAFCALLTFVSVVYAGDVVVNLLDGNPAALNWLRFQWLGIAFVPAAYLHLSDTLLRTGYAFSLPRRVGVVLVYALGLAFCILALTTDLVVRDGVVTEELAYLAAGPLFPIFALYYGATTATGAFNLYRARQRCLTPTTRRRMTYMTVSFIAPALGVFPFLLFASMSAYLPPTVVLALASLGNVAVVLMLILMGYAVAYYGILTPDRVVKDRMIHYLLRGPFVGILVVALMLAIPRVEPLLGLPQDTGLIFAVVATIVLLQVLIDLAEPFIDQVIYRQDLDEILWIQELDHRLLTSTDLGQFLENLLAALCEILRVRTAFVLTRAGGEWRLEAHTGSRANARAFLHQADDSALVKACTLASPEGNGARPALGTLCFYTYEGYWLLPLRARNGADALGLLALQAPEETPALTEPAQEAVRALISQAEAALQDRQLQQSIFDTLRRIIPELDRIQRWRSTVRYVDTRPLEAIAESPLYAPEYLQWVKDALTHYWGGPKLSRSPLLQLQVVRQALEEEGHPARALRAVLKRAIEALRPPGQRHLTASEWVLYNILEMRFVQGQRVRDIADQLAMSESDLYRKQRIAIEEVARTLAAMEERLRQSAAGKGKEGNGQERGWNGSKDGTE
ncbi:MAG: histidine kinase N-terminal 7TM domain-containing protein [Anaerolineae bacterium]